MHIYHNAWHWLLDYGGTFFQPCFVSFADEQSAIRFVLEDWLITTLLCKCALKDMPMGRRAHCAHCGVHFLIDRKRLHVSVCPRAHVIHYTDLLTVFVQVHHLGGVRKSLVIHLPGEVHLLSVLVIYSLQIYSICVFLHMFCTCLRLVSMFVLQVTSVCHCVTWETRSKLH